MRNSSSLLLQGKFTMPSQTGNSASFIFPPSNKRSNVYTNENSFHLPCKPNSTELSNRAVISYVAILRITVFATFIDIYYRAFNLK